MEAVKTHKLIHAACILVPRKGKQSLFLREVEPHKFVWFENNGPEETPTDISGPSIEEALRRARKHWRLHFFRTINCGFRYTLPERDEHGLNALFYQMVASYNSSNGVYFDDELGHNCLVNFASQEARTLWQILKQEGRL